MLLTFAQVIATLFGVEAYVFDSEFAHACLACGAFLAKSSQRDATELQTEAAERVTALRKRTFSC